MEKVFNDALISVVVPIYKVEKYLSKCIDSILNQSYKNIEVILVEDGSPDNCAKICDEYEKKDKRVKVIHKTNGGLSDARNVGIDKSTGEYITFIDSDDYIESDYIEYLYYLIKKYNTRVSSCGHNICFENRIKSKSAKDEGKVSKVEALEYILYDENIDICSWGKLYELKLFEKIKFPKGKIFEDTATTYLIFDECDYISYGNKCKYNYVMREDSITTKIFNIKKMDLIEMTTIMCNYIKSKYPELKKACDRRMMWAYISTYSKIVYTDKNEYLNEKKLIKEYINKNKKNILKDKRVMKRDKISLYVFSLGDTVYKNVWSLYKKVFN